MVYLRYIYLTLLISFSCFHFGGCEDVDQFSSDLEASCSWKTIDAWPSDDDSSNINITNVIFLNITPMDGSLYLSWSPLEWRRDESYRVLWKPSGEIEWNETIVEGKRNYTLVELDNHKAVDVQIKEKDGEAISQIRLATPSTRKNCSYPKSRLFCDTRDMSEFLKEYNLAASDLYCRNKALEEWSRQVPDCYYTKKDGTPLFKLIRSLDNDFVEKPHREIKKIRVMLRRTIWPEYNPFDHEDLYPFEWESMDQINIGDVREYNQAESFKIKYDIWFSSRITWFSPKTAHSQGVVIYHHGHACAKICTGTIIEASIIDWWLKKGWYVVHLDMPEHGINYEDELSEDKSFAMHDMNYFDLGKESPVQIFLLPIKAVVDFVEQKIDEKDLPNRKIMMGRSGGGWSTLVYSALDERIDVALPVAGWLPMSMRGRPNYENEEDWPSNAGDYEQMLPHIYNAINYIDLFRAAGSRAMLSIFNRLDECCFRLEEEDELVTFLRKPDLLLGEKISRIWIDEENSEHSTSDNALKEIDRLLSDLCQ